MMVKACVILFSLVFSFLAIVTSVKPSKNGTFIDFAKQERKIKEHPFIYAMNCLYALMVVAVCVVGTCIAWNKPMQCKIMEGIMLILILSFLCFFALGSLGSSIFMLRRVLSRKNPQLQNDVFKLILAIIATAVPSYYIAITLAKL